VFRSTSGAPDASIRAGSHPLSLPTTSSSHAPQCLVLAPRELADPGASTASWVIRFAVFYVSLLAAIIVGGSIPTLIAMI
jgi:hypothetical protein